MKRILGTWMAMGLIAGCAHAQSVAPVPAPAGPAAPTSAPADAQAAGNVDDILDALDKRGKELSDFTANVTLTDTDTAQGNDSTLSGKMWMQRLPGGDARLRVSFDRKEANGKATQVHQEYTLDKGVLTDRSYDSTKENRYQVLKPGQKMDLLKLGEGPFPLPLGQDKADVHKMFAVTKIAPAKDDPAGTEHVLLKPKAGTRFESKFSTIDFWVDPKINMPVRIVTQDPNQTTTRTTELKDVKVNAGLTDKDFTLDPIDEKKWDITERAYED